MTQDDLQAAAAVMVEAELATRKLAELHGLLGSCFGRVEPFRQAGKYIAGLMSDLPRKNAWTIAEHAGDLTPDRMQRLLGSVVWDTGAVMATVGVKRQYMGRGTGRQWGEHRALATSDGSLAYLTIRPAEPGPQGGRRYEVGVIGHGTGGEALAERVGTEITAWDQGFRSRTVRFAIPDTPPTPAADAGCFVLDRPGNTMTVIWE